jgi:hypothetical protein
MTAGETYLAVYRAVDAPIFGTLHGVVDRDTHTLVDNMMHGAVNGAAGQDTLDDAVDDAVEGDVDDAAGGGSW